MTDPVVPDSYIDEAARMLGIPVRAEWRDNIRLHLEASYRLGALVLDFPLPDDAEPAPVFRA